jgi:NADH:ubiquinone oxidoreductase subunit 6 (subunit J)
MMSVFTGLIFLLCAIVATGITEGAPALDWAWAIVFVPAVMGMIFFGLATVVLANREEN